MTEKKNLGKWLTQIGTIFETAKQSIKTGSNEVALNLMKGGLNEFEYVEEFFITSILHKNYDIFKYILDGGKVKVKENPLVNSSLIKSNLKEKTQDTNKELRENYIDIEMPYLVQAAVAGSVTIFEVLLNKGADISVPGYISLTRKKMNCLINNVLGAATFFGNLDLVKYFIENKEKLKIDWEFKSIEKSSKSKSTVYSKELTNTTPLMLAIAGETTDNNTLEIVKLLIKNGQNSKRDSYDFEGNSPLHLAVRNNKIQVVRYLVEECKYSLEECNNDGHSPFSLAQISNNKDIINYLKTFEKSSTNIDDLLELIENPKQKNQKKGKKKKERELIGLGSTEYQDILKVSTLPEKKATQDPIPTIITESKVVADPHPIETVIEPKIISIDKKEYEAYKEKERMLKEKRERELQLLEQQQKAKEAEKNKKQKPVRKEKKGKEILIKENVQYHQNNVETKLTDKVASVDNKNEIKDQTVKSEISNSVVQAEKTRNNIVGMKIKNKEPKEVKKPNDAILPEIERTVKIEPVNDDVCSNDNVCFINNENKTKIQNPEIELAEDNKDKALISENKVVKEEEEINVKIRENHPTEEISNELLEIKRRNEELELKLEEEKRSRIELENVVNSRLLNNFQTSRKIESSEENIKDLLELANEELTKKSNMICKLQSQLDYYELKNLSKLNSEDIQYLNNFFAKQIHNLAQRYEKKTY